MISHLRPWTKAADTRELLALASKALTDLLESTPAQKTAAEKKAREALRTIQGYGL